MIIALLAGCAPDDSPGIDTDAGVDTDTGEAVVPADCEDDWLVAEPTLSSTAAGTVPRLSFETTRDVATRVVFETAATGERATGWSTAGSTHEALLLGIPAATEFAWRVEVDGEEACVASGLGENGELPSGLPQIAQVEGELDTVDTSLLVAPIFTGEAGKTGWVTVLDPLGNVVFAHKLLDDQGNDAQAFRAAPARDGDGLWILEQAISEDDVGYIKRLRFDGTEGESHAIAGAHTDFVELPGGRFATLGWEVQQIGSERYLGDLVLVREADGTVRELWNAFDEIEFDPDGGWANGFYVADLNVYDWTHANGIAYDEAGDDLLVTMTAYDAVTRVDVESGEPEWVLGTGYGDFASLGERATEWPHSVQPTASNEILVFNRGDFHSDPSVCSWAAFLTLDDDEAVVSTRAAVESEDCLLVTFLGQARALPSGHLDIDWSSAGVIEEYDDNLDRVRRLELELGAAFAFTERISE